MKKSFFKYQRHEILFFLTIILFFCTYIVIKECDIPLLNFTPELNSFLEKYFVSQNADKTLYNIAISYIAAYIFYLIQIYFPSKYNDIRSLHILAEDITQHINDIKLLILLISELTDQKDNSLHPNTVKNLYIIEKNENLISRFTFLQTYHLLKERILKRNALIMSHHALSHLDCYLIEYLSALPINRLLALSDNLYWQKCNGTNTPIINIQSLSETNFIISKLEQYYPFTFETYAVSNDIAQNSIYEASNIHLSYHSDNELERKVQLST